MSIRLNAVDIAEVLEFAARVETLPTDIVMAETALSLDAAGIDAPLASSGPLDRVRAFFDREVLPLIDRKRDEFDRLQQDATDYIAKMKAENYAGLRTQRVVAIAGAAHALSNLLQGVPLTVPDFTMLGLAYLIVCAPPENKGE